MGKASQSSAPAPDPRLVDAQIKSMGIQDDSIQRVLAQADEMLPLQKQALQFGMDTSRTAYDQSQQDRTYALGKRAQLDAAQQPLIDQAKNFNQDARAAELRAGANSDIQGSFAGAQGGMVRDMSRMGLNPTSGRMAAMATGTSQAKALAMSSAAAKMNEAARREGIDYRTSAANMLSGYPAMAGGMTGAGASYGGMGQTYANAGAAGMNAGYGMAGQMGGQMGSNAAGMYGAMGNYKNGADQIAANSSPWMTLLGAGAGAGTMWGMDKLMGPSGTRVGGGFGWQPGQS